MATFSIRGKDIEITPALKQYIEKKVGKIAKYFDNLGEIRVQLAVIKGRHTVEVTVPVEGAFLRGEESTPDMYTSIDLVVDKLERQIHKLKTRLAKRFKASGFKAEIVAEEQRAGRVAATEEEGEYKIVKTKNFEVKPMDVQEAIMQMNLVNHDFFIFRDVKTEKINIVYKRSDGNYGLIDPKA